MAVTTISLQSLRTLFKSSAASLESSLPSLLESFSSSPSLISQAQQLHCLTITLGFDFNASVRNSFISFYADAGKLPSAGSIFESSHKLDFSSFSVMLAGFLKRGLFGDAHELFVEMPLRNCVSYTAPQSERCKDAIRLFREMWLLGGVPEEETMASVLSSYTRPNGDRTNARLLHGLAMKLGLDTSPIVSTNLVHLYGVGTSLDDARSVFDDMVDRDVVSWNAMLNALMRGGLVDVGRSMFQWIPGKDVVSWGTMISGCLRARRLRDALVLYREMRHARFRPDEIMMVDLLYACGEARRLEEGRQFHALAVKTGMNCSNFVQATLIHLYVSCKLISLAFLQFEDGLENALASCSTLHGLLEEGRIDDGLNLFEELQSRRWSPDLMSFFFEKTDLMNCNILLHGLCRARFVNEAHSFMRAMEDEGVTPSMVTYGILVEGLCSDGRIDMARDLLSELWSKGVRPDVPTFNIVVRALCEGGRMEEARELVTQMVSGGCLPNRVSYNIFVRGLSEKNQIDEAVPLLEEMEAKGFILDVSTFQMLLQRLPVPKEGEGEEEEEEDDEPEIDIFAEAERRQVA